MVENKTNLSFLGMFPFLALEDLKLIFLRREKALQEHMERSSISALRLFIGEHLPLLFLFPFFSIISPYRWIAGKKLKISTEIVLPLILVSLILIIASLYDKVMEHSSGPGLEPEFPDKRKNFSLFLHLPLLSSAFFYFIHPLLGLVMILFSAFFCLFLSIRAQSLYRNITPARALIYYGWSILLSMIPLFIILLVMNLFRSIDLVGDLS